MKLKDAYKKRNSLIYEKVPTITAALHAVSIKIIEYIDVYGANLPPEAVRLLEQRKKLNTKLSYLQKEIDDLFLIIQK